MEFLKNNARGIIISLLVAGVIIGIASLSNNDNVETNDEPDTAQNENSSDGAQEDSENNEEASNTEESRDDNGNSSETPETTQPEVESIDDGFVSTTENGDNQTVVVRRIVDTYLVDSSTELSAEQLLYVETNLVNDLGRNDFVAVGADIMLSESKVKQRVEEAKNLSEAALQRWSAYL